MEKSRAHGVATRELAFLAAETGSDFAAWAMVGTQERTARWSHSYGGRSNRLARMEIRPGTGIGGMAIRLGAPVRASSIENAHMLAECPVMLAEKLSSAIAFPLPGESPAQGVGVLLLGRREPVPFLGDEIRNIAAARPIWIDLSAGWRYDGGNVP